MSTGEGPQQPLKVDPELLDRYGNQLLTAAGGLPAAPAPFVVTGTDPISAAIADKLPAMEGALQTELPQLKEDASQTASRIVSAADQYQRTDQQLAADYEKHQFDRMNGSTGGAGDSGAVDGAGAAGSMGQMLNMPMQMASQAAQMPMQAMSALGSIPQGLMQGVQQISQLAGGLGGADGQAGKPGDGDVQSQRREDDRAEKDDSERGAAPRDAHAERVPDPASATSPAAQQYSPRHAAPDPTIDL